MPVWANARVSDWSAVTEGRSWRSSAWTPPTSLGSRQGLEATTTVAAPLLAGFGITLTVLVITSGRDLRWPGLVVLTSVTSAVMLILAVQLGAWARTYSASPQDIRTWFEDHEEEKDYYRRLLARHDFLYQRYGQGARLSYGAGIVLLLGALALAIAPQAGASQPLALRIASVVAGVAALLEAVWVVATLLEDGERLPPWACRLRRGLLPRLDDVEPPDRGA